MQLRVVSLYATRGEQFNLWCTRCKHNTYVDTLDNLKPGVLLVKRCWFCKSIEWRITVYGSSDFPYPESEVNNGRSE